MKKYRVFIEETEKYVVEVEVEKEEDALDAAEKKLDENRSKFWVDSFGDFDVEEMEG